MGLPNEDIVNNEEGRILDPTKGDVVVPQGPTPQFTPSFGQNYGDGGYVGDQTTGNDQHVMKMLSLLQQPNIGKTASSTFNFIGDTDPITGEKISDRFSRWVFGQDNEELSHQAQSGWDRFANWGVNLVGKAVAYTAQNLGFMVGAPIAVLTGDISNMTDNFLTKMGEGMKAGLENDFPIYKGLRYRNGNIWQKMTTWDWWLDDATDRVSLTASMFIPGALEAKGIGLFGAAYDEAGNLIRATGPGTKALQALAQDPERYSFLAKTFVPKLYKAATTGAVDASMAPELARYARGLQRAELYTWNVIGQSGLNAMETSDAITKYLRDQRNQGLNNLSDEDIKQKAAMGAKRSFWETVPVTFAGSLLEIPMMYATMRGAKSALTKFNPLAADLGESAALSAIKPSKWKTLFRAAYAGLEHGQNESMQVAISRYNEENLTGRDPRGTIPGILGDFIDNVNDPNGQNNIALGTIQGILMGLGGAAISNFTKSGKEQQAARVSAVKGIYHNINAAMLTRMYQNGDFILRDPETGKPIIENGEYKLDPSKVAATALSIDGIQRRLQMKKAAVDSGDYSTYSLLEHKSLSALAYPFLGDPNGMDHLEGIFAMERDAAKKDPNRFNDTDENGVEMTPDEKYQRDLQTVRELKKAYDTVQNNHAGFTDLGIDTKGLVGEEKTTELRRATDFLNKLKYAQYNEASNQIFIKNLINRTETAIAILPIEKEDKSKPFEDPSSPDEEKFNDLLDHVNYAKELLQDSKDTYKKLIDKGEWRDAYKEHKSFEQSVLQIAGKFQSLPETPPATLKVRGEELQFGREYQLNEPLRREDNNLYLYPKLTPLSPTYFGKVNTKLPSGEVALLSPKQIGDYDISPDVRDQKDFEGIVNAAIDKVAGRQPFANLGTEIDEKGAKTPYEKLAIANSMNNEKLSDAIEEQIRKDSKDWQEKQKQIKQEAEKLGKIRKQFYEKLKTSQQGNGGTPTSGGDVRDPAESDKKASEILYIATTSPSKNLKPHHIREAVFFNNKKFFKRKGKRLKTYALAFTINQESALGLDGLVKNFTAGTSYEGTETNPTDGNVMIAYVEKEGDSMYFLDKKGNRLGKVGEKVDINNVIASTMPTSSLTWQSGEKRYRDNKEDEEAAIKYSRAWASMRKEIFAASPEDVLAGKYVYGYTISRGQPILVEKPETGIMERVPVTKALIKDEDLGTQGLITVSTDGKFVHDDQTLNWNPGTPILEFEDTVTGLENRTFTKEEATNIYNLLLELSKKPGEFYKTDESKRIINYLKSILYWGEFTDDKNTGRNQVYIDFSRESGTDDLIIGNKKTRIEFTPTSLESKKDTIIAAFQTAYNSVNNHLLTKKNTERYEEITGIDKDGKIQSRVWKTYQHYLLSPDYYNEKGEKGGVRGGELPLFTHVRPINADVENDYNFEQKYAILQGLDLQPHIKEQQKKEVKKTEVKKSEAGKYVGDGETVNTYTTKAGDKISFKYTDPTILSILPDEGYKAAIERISKTKPLIDSLRKNGATGKDEDVADTFLRKSIQLGIEAQAPKEIEKTDIEAKKADIERRRQEELGNIENEVVGGFTRPNEKERARINAKYDAELAALEGKKTVEETPAKPAKKTLGGKGTAPKASLATNLNVARMNDADFQAFKQWHAKNVPQLPFEVLQHMIEVAPNTRLWGVYEDGVAKFYKAAKKGTEYHETFHQIKDFFLTDEQWKDIADEVRQRGGNFKTAEGTVIPYIAATDDQVEEKLADEFSQYVRDRIHPLSLTQKIRNFFKSIIRFFSSFGRSKSLAEDLFRSINRGEYARKTPIRQTGLNSKYSAAGLTETDTHLAVQDIVGRAGAFIIGNDNYSLWNLQDRTFDEIFNEVKRQWSEPGEDGESKLDVVGEAGWGELVDKAKDMLKTLQIEFDDENKMNINDEGVNNKGGFDNYFKGDWKKSSPIGVKLFLSFLPKTDKTSDKVTLNGMELTGLKGEKEKMIQLMNKSQVFATLLDRLNGSTSLDDMMQKLVELAQDNSDYERVLARMNVDVRTGKVDWSKMSNDDVRTILAFQSVFSRSKYVPYTQFISEDGAMRDVRVGSALQADIINQTVGDWVENMKDLATQTNSYVKYDRGRKVYVVDKSIASAKIETAEDIEKFLSRLGIPFPAPLFNRIRDIRDRNIIRNSVSKLRTFIGEGKHMATLSGEVLSINSRLKDIARVYTKMTSPNQDSSFFNEEGEMRQLYENPNYVHYFSNIFNSGDEANIEDLYKALPYLKTDVFAQHSLILKPGGKFFNEKGERVRKLTVGYAGGMTNTDGGDGSVTKNMQAPDRLVQEINNNLVGNHYVMLSADGSTDHLINLGNQISYTEFLNPGRVWQTIYNTFYDYLRDEVALAQDDQRVVDTSVKSKAKDLRFMKGILGPLAESIKESVINGDKTLDEFMAEKDNLEKFRESVSTWLENITKTTKDSLLSTNRLKYRDDKSYSFKDLNNTFTDDTKLNKYDLSEEDIRRVLLFRTVNYSINNIELHKLMYGDPYQYDIKEKDKALDEVKRIKLSTSPAKALHVSSDFNNYANREYNLVNGRELPDALKYNFKDFFSTSTLSLLNGEDVVGSSYFNGIKGFEDTPEADSFSIMMGGTYRNVKIRTGQWDNLQDEDFYQYDEAYKRQDLFKKGLIEEKNYPIWLQNADKDTIQKGEPIFHAEVMKTKVFGGKYGQSYISIVGDKFAQMPIFYSKLPEGSDLQKLYIKMFKEGRDYVIMKSGRKMGSEGVHDLYTPNGKFNDEPFNNNVNVDLNTYSIQVENSYDEDKKQTMGSQARRLVTEGLMEHGLPIDISPEDKEKWTSYTEEEKEKKSPIYKATQWHDKLDRALVEEGYQTLLKRLGVEEVNGEFVVSNYANAAKLLQGEIKRRGLSDNAIESISIDPVTGKFKIAAEASPKYKQIRDILYSLIDKSLIRPSVNGKMSVQVPYTLWNNSEEGRGLAIKRDGKWVKLTPEQADKLSDKDKKNVRLTSNSLHWYTKEEPWIGVMLPAKWIGSKLEGKELYKLLTSTEEGRKILEGIDFRIPTQSLSSIDAFRIQGFLPEEYGDTIVVPSEITTKAGSDFDIDKLNTYLKNVYIDRKGTPRLIKFYNVDTNNEAQMRDFYEDNILEKFKKFKAKEGEQKELADIDEMKLAESFSDLFGEDEGTPWKEDIDVENDLQKSYVPDFNEWFLDNKGKDIFDINKNWGKFNYKKALENEYFDSMRKLLQLPENYERILRPVTDEGLKDIANNVAKMAGTEEKSTEVSQMLDPNYISRMRNIFLQAKKWIAIAALNITHNSLAQRKLVYIDPARATDEIKKYFGDGSITLPHNEVEINGKKYITLSALKNEKGETISDTLSGFASGIVDAPKNPFITNIVPSSVAINTALGMVRIGVDKETIAQFLNQPILRDFYRELEASPSQFLFNDKTIKKIKSNYPTKAKQTTFDPKSMVEMLETYRDKKALSDADNAQQVAILDEFLKISRIAQSLTDLMLSTNYDTARYTSSDVILRKNVRTQATEEENIIRSVEGILSASFIAPQRQRVSDSNKAISKFLAFEGPEARAILDRVMEDYSKDKYISGDDYQKISDTVRYKFLDYLVQKIRGLNNSIEGDLVNLNTSVAKKILDLQKKYPNNEALKMFKINGLDYNREPKNVKVAVNLKDAYDENLYTGYLRQLRDEEETADLYKDILRLAMIQGTQQSPLSFTNLIPIEDYVKIVSPAINAIPNLPPEVSENFLSLKSIHRNSWMDKKMVPSLYPQTRTIKDKKTGEYIEAIPIYHNVPEVLKKRYNSPGNIQIIALSKQYQRNAINRPVISLRFEDPKYNDKRELVEKMVSEGDYSFMVTKLYQRVMDGDKALESPDNLEVIYKQINAWGDGFRGQEYWDTARKSVIDNNTRQVERELTDQEIIDTLKGGAEGGREFDKLPPKSPTPTMTYAGIGSRQTPADIQKQMTDLAKELESKGYTLNSGGADGADKAFEIGATKKEIFLTKDATDRTRKIAREIHPNPSALGPTALNLMARNTNQVFGRNLDKPVDFVLTWTEDGATSYQQRTRNTGGTGQAIEMASRKGIPVINMRNPNWRQELDSVLENKPVSTESKSTVEDKPIDDKREDLSNKLGFKDGECL